MKNEEIFINITSEKEYSGKLAGFDAIELSDGNKGRAMTPCLGFEDGRLLALFHIILKKKIKSGIKSGVIKPGATILIKQMDKIEGKENEYYDYSVFVDGKEIEKMATMDIADFEKFL